MRDPAEMNELAARKRLLAIESELNRQALRHETAHIRQSLGRWKEILGTGRTAYPLVLAAAPLAGLFVSRKTGRWAGLITKALIGYRLARRFYDLWRSFKEKPSRGAETAA
jgi:hypothetical protein